jgi:hypothetical protein
MMDYCKLPQKKKRKKKKIGDRLIVIFQLKEIKSSQANGNHRKLLSYLKSKQEPANVSSKYHKSLIREWFIDELPKFLFFLHFSLLSKNESNKHIVTKAKL